MVNLNKKYTTKTKYKPKPTCKFKTARVCVHSAQLSKTIQAQNSSDYFPS